MPGFFKCLTTIPFTLLTALLALTPLTACDGTDPAGCVPGKVETCPCVGGTEGVQVCLEDRTFGACDCGEDPPDGGVDGDVEEDVEGDAGTDGDVDGDHPLGRCSDPGDCEAPATCVGRGCVDPVDDPEAYVTEAASRCASWVWTIQFPRLFPEPETCCFDFDEDGILDDAYGQLLGVMGTMQPDGWDPVGEEQASIDSFSQLLVIDWVTLPETGDGDVRLSWFTGAPESDGGVGAADPEQWRLGLGTAFLHPGDFGTHGSLWQINASTVVDDVVEGQGGPLLLWLPGVFTGPGLRPTLLHDVRLRVPLPAAPTGCRGAFSENLLVTPEGEATFTAGGLTLGGLIRFEEQMDHLDSVLRSCTCAGVDPDQPVIQWSLEQNGYDVTCNEANRPDDGSGCTELDDPACATSRDTCNFITMWTSLLDVDSDGDGVEDALSVGLRLGFSAVGIGGLVR